MRVAQEIRRYVAVDAVINEVVCDAPGIAVIPGLEVALDKLGDLHRRARHSFGTLILAQAARE